MAIEKIISIKADTKDAVKGIEDVSEALKGVEEQSENSEEAIENVGKSAKKQKTVVKGLGASVRAVGTALKAIGIGLIIALVAKLTDVFSKNQKVIDFVNTASTTLSIVFNELFDVISNVYVSIRDATGGFDAFGKVISGLVTIGLTPLKLSFYGISLAVKEAQLAWEKSFFGDKDPETVKNLNKSIEETKDAILQVGIDSLDAALKVKENFKEAVGEFSTAINTIATEGVEGVRNISVSSAIEQAKAITNARKNYELLSLTQDRLMLQYQNEAEILRQIRDDESISIKERIDANNKITEILNKQFEAESKSIKSRIAGLQQEQNLLGKTIERTNEIYQLQTDLIDVEERLQGQRSEQKVNNIALLKEEIELNQVISDSEKERQLAQLEFEAGQEEKELEKLEKLRERLDLENEIILEDLERKRELYAEGTLAREEAEQDFLTRKQDIDNQITDNEKKQNQEKEKDDKIVNETKVKLATTTLGLLDSIANEGSDLAKGVAVAQALINTYQGITSELATKTFTPFEFGLKIANIASVTAIGFKSVKDILKTKVQKGGGGSGASEPSKPSAPNFNLVSGSSSSQIAEGLQTQNEPIQAYVVSGNVTSSQELDRNIIENSGI